MTTYYCNLGEGTFADRSGADSTTNVLTGPGGAFNAIWGNGAATDLAAGDSLLCYGTGDMTRLVLIDCAGTDVSAWAIGDAVRNYNGSGDDWTGVVVCTNSGSALGAADLVLVWLASGKTPANIAVADGIENTAVGASPAYVDPITSAIYHFLDVNKNAGSAAAGFIKFIGVNSSYVNDGTRAKLLGNDGGNYQRGFRIQANMLNIWIENFEFEAIGDTGSKCAIYATATAYRNQIINCYFHDCNDHALNTLGTYSTVMNCVFKDVTDTAIVVPQNMIGIYDCSFINCGVAVSAALGEDFVQGCLFIGCGIAIALIDDVFVDGCTFIGVYGAPAGVGIAFTYAGHQTITNCRFAYLASGITLEHANDRVCLRNCYFGGNTADIGGTYATQYELLTNRSVATVTLAGSETRHGMIDPEHGDYNLDPDQAAAYNVATSLEM